MYSRIHKKWKEINLEFTVQKDKEEEYKKEEEERANDVELEQEVREIMNEWRSFI